MVAAAIQVGQLDLVLAVFVAGLAEIVVFSGETFDERFRVGHADLLARRLLLLETLPQPAWVHPLILPGSEDCQGLAWRSRMKSCFSCASSARSWTRWPPG